MTKTTTKIYFDEGTKTSNEASAMLMTPVTTTTTKIDNDDDRR